MKRLLIVVALLAGCAPEPEKPLCNYCAKGRVDARPYTCRKCGQIHYSCALERPMHVIDVNKDKDGFTMGRSVKTCPEGR